MAESGKSFREVADALHRATLEGHSFDLGSSRFELNTSGEGAGDPLTLVFEGVSNLRWIRRAGDDPAASPTTLTVVGLERLADGEPWRLYLHPSTGGELELACDSVTCDGIPLTGIGRAYRS